MKKFKKFFSIILLAAVSAMVLVPALSVFAASQTVLKVAFVESYGIMMKSDDGKRSGIAVDYLDEIAKYTGWKYEYVDFTGQEAEEDSYLTQFSEGKLDLIAGQYYSPGAESAYGYSKYNIGYSKGVLLAKWDDEETKSFDLSTFNGKVIGAYNNKKPLPGQTEPEDTELIRRLRIFLSMNGIECTIKTYDKSQQENNTIYKYLSNGEVDLLLGNTSDANSGFRVVTSFDSQPYYIVCQPQNRAVLESMNAALENIYASNPNFAEERAAENIGDLISANIVLINEEKEYIKTHPKIRVSIFPLKPMFIVDEKGSYGGILPDTLEVISKTTGLSFEYVVSSSYSKAIEAVKNGAADVMGLYPDDRDTATELGLSTTAYYVKVSRSLVRNKKVSYPADGLICGLLKGRHLPEDVKASEIRYFDNIADALDAVDKGSIDLAYGFSAQLEKDIQDNHFSNIVPIALADNLETIRFAVNRPADAMVFNILNKAINLIGDAQMEEIKNRHTASIGVGSYSLSDFIYSNPMVFASIIVAIVVMLISIVSIIYFYRLRSQKTQLALDKAYADSKAKSDFLSRMSHEIRTPMNAVIGLADLTVRQKDVPEGVKNNLSKISSSSHYLLGLLNDILDMGSIESGMLKIAKDPFSLDRMLDELDSMMSAEAERNAVKFCINCSLENTRFIGDPIRLRQVLTNLIANSFKFTPINGCVSLDVNETVSGAEEASSEVEFVVKDNGAGIAKEDQARIFEAFEQANVSIAKSQGTGLGLSISRNIVQLMGGELKLRSEVGKGSEFFFTITLRHADAIEKERVTTDENFLKGMNILLAEDNDLNAEITQDMLQMVGAQVFRAENGKEALAAFCEDPEKFDAILMDIQMPLMNGLEATKAIRGLDLPRAKTVPIIAMTANTFKEDSDEAIAAGMNEFVSKPVNINFLYSVLKSFSDI